jgi:hypothetical protein
MPIFGLRQPLSGRPQEETIMTRLTPIDPAAADGKAKALLDGVTAKLGMTPNMMATMAQSPAVLDAYLCFATKSPVSPRRRSRPRATVPRPTCASPRACASPRWSSPSAAA